MRWFLILLCVPVMAQTYTVLANFDGINGAYPYGVTLVQGANGNLYGATYGEASIAAARSSR